MALNLHNKKEIISKINKISNLSLSAIIADPQNICVNLLNQLRQKSRKNNVNIYVIKNTLLKIALKNTHFECLNNTLTGPTLIGFSRAEPGSGLKLFKQFYQENKTFKIITAAHKNKILSPKEIDYLANLPSYQEAITIFILTIKYATIGRIFSILLSLKNKKNNNSKNNT